MTHPAQAIIDDPPQYFFPNHITWLESKTSDQLKEMVSRKKENDRLMVMTDEEYDEEIRYERWCRKHKGNHARNVSKWEAQEVFKDNLYGICMSKIGAGEQQDAFEGLSRDIKSNRDKLDVERAKAVDIKDLVRSFGYEIKKGFVKCMFHDDRTGSMSFKFNRFKCFGCGAGGDSIEFFMRTTGTNFPNTVKKLTNQ